VEARKMSTAQVVQVGLMDFADFACKRGSKKNAQMKVIKERMGTEYELFRDFYKRLREGIVEFHKVNKPLTALDAIPRLVSDPKKRVAFAPVILDYRSFLNGKTTKWFDPPKGPWSHQNLTVRVNPELGLTFDGKDHVIKLYFKKPVLPIPQMLMTCHLMAEALHHRGEHRSYGVLDVRRKRFVETDVSGQSEIQELKREADLLLQKL
jgi:hypothetical protein